MRKNQSESGRSLIETLVVLVIIAILLLASLLGYSFVVRKYKRDMTVKAISELAIRYKLHPIAKEPGKVAIKLVYPEAARADATTMKTADTDEGRVKLEVEGDDPSYFQIVVSHVLNTSCEAMLKQGEYDAVKAENVTSQVLQGTGIDAAGDLIIGKGVLNNLPKEKKAQVVSAICGSGRLSTFSLVSGKKCPDQMGGGHWYAGRCWTCTEGLSEDRYGQCCSNPEKLPCGVCRCPNGICANDGSGQCVECNENTDCRDPNKPVCENHKCVRCKPTTQEGCVDAGGTPFKLNKRWCSFDYECEECLDSYDETETDEWRCPSSKPSCNKEGGVTNWKCEEWPCAQELFKDACRDGISGQIKKNGKCSEKCACGPGLICQEPTEEPSCSTCQCENDEGKYGDSCNDDCPCGTNDSGTQLKCVNNKCTCLALNEVCTNDDDCCNHSCIIPEGEEKGHCSPKTCQKSENESCTTNTDDWENCCKNGYTCKAITGKENTCCPSDEGKCSSDACCPTGYRCDVRQGRCMPECSSGGSCSVGETSGANACCAGQNCISQDGITGTCCPSETNGDGSAGAICEADACCVSGKCVDNATGGKKCCPETDGTMGSACNADGCCNTGLTCQEGTCQPSVSCSNTEEDRQTQGAECSDDCPCGEGLTCSHGHCCQQENNSYWWMAPERQNGTCCSVEGGIPNEQECSDNGDCCQSGYCSIPSGETKGLCCPQGVSVVNGHCASCSNTQEDRQEAGSECSDPNCPCGDNLECNAGHCCPQNAPNWVTDGNVGHCCRESSLIPLGGVCGPDSCCEKGSCMILEGETEGVCCSSTTSVGADVQPGDPPQCCAGGYIRQVYTKKVAKEVTTYPCIKTKKSKCQECYCGKCTKTTCHVCDEYDYSKPTTKVSSWLTEGSVGPERCCAGNGDIGSPCSDECPCQGTMFMYYQNGEVTRQDSEPNYNEGSCYYNSCACTRSCTPSLYCAPTGKDPVTGKTIGVCQERALDKSGVDYSANEVSCSYAFDFKNANTCYLCPADTVFRSNDTYVACCARSQLAISQQYCKRYKRADGYEPSEAKSEEELGEGLYYDEATGLMSRCPKGSYCVGDKRYLCDVGTYQDKEGSKSCRGCGVGYYCPEEGMDKRFDCPIGFYCPDTFTRNAAPCPPGTYTTQKKRTSEEECVPCPANYYCPGGSDKISCNNKTLPGACPEGGMSEPLQGKTADGEAEYVYNKKLTLCPKGSYCDGSNKYACNAGYYSDYTGADHCEPAPVGVAISQKGSKGSSENNVGLWQKCPRGTYAEGTANVECKKCPSGTYQNETGQSDCKPCPDGKKQSSEGAIAESSCTACEKLAETSSTKTKCCSATYKVVKNEATGYEECCPSNKDRYCRNNSGQYACRLNKDCALSEEDANETCEEKQYISNGKCTTCDAGYGCNGSSRTKCNAGTYAAKGDGVCTPCPAGTYQDEVGKSSCKKLSSGNKYTDEEGATTYKTCTGNTAVNSDHTGCDECPSGTKPDTNHTKCVPNCKAGFVAISGGCRTCSTGYYCPNGYEEIQCPEGEFSGSGASSCTKCSVGTYWDPLTSKCKTCPAGSRCENGKKIACPEGTMGKTGATQCANCDPGEYYDKSCKPCAPGTYSKGGAVQNCTDCPKGTYQPEGGKGSCEPCPENTYNSGTKKTSCNSCPKGKSYSGTGATASSQCT